MTDMHSDSHSLFLSPSPLNQHGLDPGRTSNYNQYYGCHTPFTFFQQQHQQQQQQQQQMLRNRVQLHTSMMDASTLNMPSMAPSYTSYRLSTEYHPSYFDYNHDSHVSTPDSDMTRSHDTSQTDSPDISEDVEPFHFTTLPTQDTLEPMMTIRRYDSLSLDRNSEVDVSPMNHAYDFSILDYTSPPRYSTNFLDQSLVSDEEPSPDLTETTLYSPPYRPAGEDDDSMDKPYARLIHEALMQAPGHRMMLKEIYEWFIQNTNKPQESGTNGWQNSIRHNLSMNQAFENDKSICSSTRGTSRKANSVWILTEDAIRNGVQSTTRYRKTCSIKKGSSGRMPASHRQRSGARGGRAAHRSAVRLRRREEMPRSDKVYSSDTPTSTLCQYPNLESATFDEDMFRQALQHEQTVTTPTCEGDFKPLYALPNTASVYHTAQPFKMEHDDFFEPDSYMHDYFYHSGSLTNIDEVSKFDTD